MYSNNIVNFQESTTIVNASKKKAGNSLNLPRQWVEERDETVNHIVSEYGQIELKEYKTKHDWVGKMIY